ncbi:hypothetical protein C1645_873316 [Glomus cerebriforme]|uniref:Uncharacterized protein n=1 Tax=Glomus cerebriforme TaxID=658196 RepID=A0A397TBF0_9GLOM|nr:hypothetical protein C1645_873316 [Glomus cerebriforme]
MGSKLSFALGEKNEVYDDPLLVIEWNPAGLAHRYTQNLAQTKNALIAMIRLLPDCGPFPAIGTPSTSIFSPTAKGATPVYQVVVDVTAALAQQDNW